MTTNQNPEPWSNDLESVLKRIYDPKQDPHEAAKRCAKIVADSVRANAEPLNYGDRQAVMDIVAADIFTRENLDFFLEVMEAEAQANPWSDAKRGRHAVPWNRVSPATEYAEEVGRLTWLPPLRVF